VQTWLVTHEFKYNSFEGIGYQVIMLASV